MRTNAHAQGAWTTWRTATTTRAGANGTNAGKSAGMATGARADRCTCLLYTSDAADEEDSVDLGGRRIIKKKKKKLLMKKIYILNKYEHSKFNDEKRRKRNR
eukprot:TRINITY_DN5535_c0_g1_i2.p1 TRINITY_DN5535_c0_g1~~TRINITY_DN5535_c0_g1_i2.p1  ORF type:complete len:102 (-),score=15.21 TRINITY_DN5535_c0_g1_i2:24-329(-)